MKNEFSAGAVLYQKTPNGIRYILVVERSGHCGFPKGHIENGETEKEAALREIREETGAFAKLIGDFKIEIDYFIGNGTKKHVTFFLAECPAESKTVAARDIKALHILPFDKAREALSHDNSRAILDRASEYIKQYE